MSNNLKVTTGNINQHLLYSYNHPNKIGPNEDMRDIFGDDLIFDRSRKSIFTQYEEFGYISDYTYSVIVDNTYITLHSYEGSLDIIKYKPVHINNITLTNVSNLVDQSLTISSLYISYDSTSTLFKSYIYLNGSLIKTVTSNPHSYDNLNSGSTHIRLGSNELKVITYANETTYLNTNYNNRYSPHTSRYLESYDSYVINIIGGYETSILTLPTTYSNISKYNWTGYTMNTKFVSDKYKMYLNETPHKCTNTKNQLLCIKVHKNLESSNEILPLVGGVTTEMVKVKSENNYNYYVAKKENWSGLNIWFN